MPDAVHATSLRIDLPGFDLEAMLLLQCLGKCSVYAATAWLHVLGDGGVATGSAPRHGDHLVDGCALRPAQHLDHRTTSSSTTPGCTFSVNAISSGLRVHWSGAYRISGNYFSHPTSPASSVLQSGVYIFGVDGGAYTSPRWDTCTKVTLPGPHTSIMLNY